jgi:hypothetical protein
MLRPACSGFRLGGTLFDLPRASVAAISPSLCLRRSLTSCVSWANDLRSSRISPFMCSWLSFADCSSVVCDGTKATAR